MSRPIPCDVYLEIEPVLHKWRDEIEKARVARHTKTKPDNVGKDNVVIKLRIFVPEHLFVAGVPEAVISVSDDPSEPVTVTAFIQED